MIIDPDEHPDRHRDPATAFADARRRLRDEVLTDERVRRVYVMIGAPGSGKSTHAKELRRDDFRADERAYVDGCHADAPERRRLARQIRDAGKIPIAVFMRTPLAECLRRNNQREPPRRVPPSTVRRMSFELEKRPPRKVEGWHEVIEVA